jgi:predicted amidohydrolase YtcJ
MRSAVVAALAATLGAGLLVATGAYSGWGNGGGAVRQAAPDLILYNGKISTVDPDNSTVQAVAIRNGEIIATGRSGRVRSLAKRSTQRVNLASGACCGPDRCDAARHPHRLSLLFAHRRVRHGLLTPFDTVYSRSEALAEFARVAARTPDGAWVFTMLGSFAVGQLDVPGMFSRTELDAVAPDNPVRVSGSGFTGTRVSTKALETLGLEAGDSGVVVDGSGQPTGQLTGPRRARSTGRSGRSSSGSRPASRPSAWRSSCAS